MEAIDRIFPLSIIDEVVPFGDQVIDRASRVSLAKGRSTIHTSGCLHLALHVGMVLFVGFRRIQFSPVEHAFQRLTVWFRVSFVVDETSKFFNGGVRTIATLDPVKSYGGSEKRFW